MASSWRANALDSLAWLDGAGLVARIRGRLFAYLSDIAGGGGNHQVYLWDPASLQPAVPLDMELIIGGGPHFPYGFDVDPDG